MRPGIFSLALTTAFLFSSNAGRAQQSNQSVPPVPQHLEELKDDSHNSKNGLPQPSPEMQSLMKVLSGKWSVKVKFEPNSGMPNGLLGDGEETWRAGPGGFTFLDEEQVPTPEGEVFLLGIIWWDGQSKDFHGMECNNQLPHTCDLKSALNDITIKWDGKELTIDELEKSPEGKKTMWHEVWSNITPSSFTQTGDTCEPGGSCKRFVTIHGTRPT